MREAWTGQAERKGGSPGQVLTGIEEPEIHAVLAGELLDDLAVFLNGVEVVGRDSDEPGVGKLGVSPETS